MMVVVVVVVVVMMMMMMNLLNYKLLGFIKQVKLC
jgi:hypothetical protein